MQQVRRAGRPFRLSRRLILWTAGVGLVGVLSLITAVVGGLLLVSASNRVLPGVSAGRQALGGVDLYGGAAILEAELKTLTLRDGDRTWDVPLSALGGTLDAKMTAASAVRYGRGDGSILTGLFGRVDVPPVIYFEPAILLEGLQALAGDVILPARNATVRYQNGAFVPVSAVEGRNLDTGEMAARLANLRAYYRDGAVDLAMRPVAPTVTDATPLVAQAQSLLASPLVIAGYNPITNQTLEWRFPPDMWGVWLTTTNTPTGVAFSLDGRDLAVLLEGKNAEMGGAQAMRVSDAVEAASKAVAAGQARAVTRLYNPATRYTVLSGDTLGTISWQFGIQMFRIQRANPGVNLDALYPGQSIVIPSKDDLLPNPVVPDKRIIVSIARQRMWVYERGALKWEWSASTGIPDSPTMPGVFQILSHEGTAYAGNWNLYMPYFMGIYEAVPGFTNGIHGFPSRGGAQILWENALGRKVTYGCVLLSTANAKALYEWAEDGVVVEVQP